MQAGFIGAGNVTRTIGRHLINAGHTIVVSNSRGPETLGEFVAELGPGAGAGTKQQSTECDMVRSALRYLALSSTLSSVLIAIENGESMKTTTLDSVTISDLDQPGYFKTGKL